eukprot:TRINITY_DN2090_c0_g3_i1.p1 TRINITY_DN2090_c0_g3~~TRINITY_DN2090_c0_g3_i1.p1  ORF type:complete len:187 (-),score=25.80 TRINITY_DN2090_c0_g3_i1:325-885(-)
MSPQRCGASWRTEWPSSCKTPGRSPSRRAPFPEQEVWSDASSTAWAAVVEREGATHVAHAAFEPPADLLHIFIKEVAAAVVLVRVAVALGLQGLRLKLRVDNMAAVLAIRRGHSSNFLAITMLCALFRLADANDLGLEPEWVGTLLQRADEYTRGTVAPFQARRAAVACERAPTDVAALTRTLMNL